MNNQAHPNHLPTTFVGTFDAAKENVTTPAVPIVLPSLRDNKTTTSSNLFRPRKREVHPFAFAEDLLAMIDQEYGGEEDDLARRLAQACQA